MGFAPDLPDLAPTVIEAKHYGAVRTVPVMYVVIHTAETLEVSTGAENVARYFSPGPDGKGPMRRNAEGKLVPVVASAHFTVDDNSIVQCVPLSRVAYAAPGANHNGIQIELTGRAAQTPVQWEDPFSQRELLLAAKLTARLLRRYGRKAIVVGPKGLVAGKTGGITGHWYVNEAFHKSTHTDPGKGFPWSPFRQSVASLMAA